MFPTITQLEFVTETEETIQLGRSFLFDFNENKFVMENGKFIVVEGIEALKMWIEKTIRTEKFRFKIYEKNNDRDSEYGVRIEDLIIGNDYPILFIESELKREITDALLKHPAISNLSEWLIDKEDDVLNINFTVELTDGVIFKQGVSING